MERINTMSFRLRLPNDSYKPKGQAQQFSRAHLYPEVQMLSLPAEKSFRLSTYGRFIPGASSQQLL
jgi:hypothetical protein